MICLVRDIALQAAVMVQPQVEIRTAEQLLISRHATEVFVVDDSEMLLGIVPDLEILNYRLMGGDGQARIGALMSQATAFIEWDDSIEEACRLLKEQPSGTLPVVQAGRVIGQLCRWNLLKLLAESMPQTGTGFFPVLTTDALTTSFAKPAKRTWIVPGELRGAG